METVVLLLGGPDGRSYTATNFAKDTWYVSQFLDTKQSDWWKSNSYNQWGHYNTYTTESLEETFTILAEKTVYGGFYYD
jgi:hypothetical protein